MTPNDRKWAHDWFSRRRVLALVGAASVPVLSGCAPLQGDGPPGGHVLVANRRDQEARIAVVVTETAEGGETIIDGIYRVPGAYVLEFEEALETGNASDLRVRQPGDDAPGEEQLSISFDACGDEDPSNKLDVEVRITDHGPDVITHDCDEEYSRDGDMTYVEPGEYWIGPVEGTPTSTPDSWIPGARRSRYPLLRPRRTPLQ